MNDTSLLRPNNDAERTFDVFFYGLHMDPNVLVSKGVVPRDPRVAFVDDHVVRLGAKAMLLRSHGGRAYGMLFRLTHPEMDALYADAHDYRSEAFSVRVVDPAASARPAASISMVHRAPPIDSAQDPDYAVRWTSIVQRLGIPVDAVRLER